MNGLITLCIPVQPTGPSRSVTGFLLKNSRKVISWLLIATMGSSCCTTALWDATDPNETIEVSPDEITAAALIEDGFIFHRDEVSGYFHIEKPPSEKAGDYALRVVGTPVAVSTDILLVGVFSMYAMYAPPYALDSAQADWSTLNM